ncbi:DUF2125 domain-containing protein [Nitrospirillum sp. BR 11164]|uniref:DUF2125 domain-containing protein n=1 Tax=Nitrospirillum sp. BR 11164 TaxID=3104324 RepID=UPI002AFFBBD0|nr:DUF2125 domain-containing protein [Nitrospirillum sp. BR 11164]MEA1650045.1 DUF2125 domain-containing protein [Nitrospirillum sp. BR 11164]
MRVRPLTLVLFLVLVLVTGYAVWWHRMATRLLGLLEHNTELARAAGATITYQPPTLGGFPLGISITATDVKVAKPDGLSWLAETVKASAPIWRLDQVVLTLAKGGHASLPREGARPALDATATIAGGRVTLDLATGTPRSVQVNLNHATLVAAPLPAPEGAPAEAPPTDGTAAAAPPASLVPAGSYPIEDVSVTVERPVTPPTDHTGTGLALHVDITNMTVPPVRSLGTTVQRLILAARVQGPIPAAPTADAVTPWSKEGGTVEVDSLKLDWGDLHMGANATLALDANLQPQGSGTAELSGLDNLVDALHDGGSLRGNAATWAHLGVALLAKPKANGGPPTLKLPITMQDHKLQVGPLTVAHYPDISWH